MAEAQLEAKRPTALTIRQFPRLLSHSLSSIVSHGILLSYSILALFPIFLILTNSFKDRKDLFRVPYQPPLWFSFETGSIVNLLSTKGYEQVFARADVFSYFGNSLIVTSVSLLLILLTGAMASYALAEYHFRGNRFLGLFMALGIMIPIRLVTVCLIRLTTAFGIYNTVMALILVYAGSVLPIAVFIMSEF